MITLQGKYGIATVYTDNIDNTTIAQIIELCNQPFVAGEDIRIMPDCHAGAGCVIGTTMTLRNKKVVPNLVGVDVGCGVSVVKLDAGDIDFKRLDRIIRENIPSGFSVREKAIEYPENLVSFVTHAEVKYMNRQKLSMGTLGGGNHFIEVDVDEDGKYYLVVHTGSRNFGKQIAEYWQNVAADTCIDATKDSLAYLEGENFEKYMTDMRTAQKFAMFNRATIWGIIVEKMNFTFSETFESVHNYIDFENLLLRKGAISAEKDKKLIIPINMRDGSILAMGRGSLDWNLSAPHGAGRILSRGEAKRKFSMDEYEQSMQGIFSTSVMQSTLDECPMAYKPIQEIISNIGDSVDIYKIIRPVYNFKSSSGE